MKISPAYCRPVAFDAFRSFLPGIASIDELFRAAWAVAWHEHPDADLVAGETAVENLGATVAGRLEGRGAHPPALLAHLHDVLFDVVGLQGNVDDYYAPENSYVPKVLARRRGIPITLTLLYARVAAEVGLTVHGINAPGHFLAEVENCDGRGGSMYVDPFHRGRVLTSQEALRQVTAITGQEPQSAGDILVRATGQQWLDRILNNLQASLATAGRDRDVFAMQELQQLLRLECAGD